MRHICLQSYTFILVLMCLLGNNPLSNLDCRDSQMKRYQKMCQFKCHIFSHISLLKDILLIRYSENNSFSYLDCRDSKMERYQKMWRFMESHTADTFVPSYEEGVKRVLNGSYAFLGESAMLDYLVQRNCNLTQIGGLLDSKGIYDCFMTFI